MRANRGNTKNYINHDLKEKQCGECKEIKKFTHFSFQTKGYLQTNCKPCRSKIKVRKDLETRANTHPNLFLNCGNEDCDHIWLRSRGNKCLKCTTEGVDYI